MCRVSASNCDKSFSQFARHMRGVLSFTLTEIELTTNMNKENENQRKIRKGTEPSARKVHTHTQPNTQLTEASRNEIENVLFRINRKGSVCSLIEAVLHLKLWVCSVHHGSRDYTTFEMDTRISFLIQRKILKD